MAAAIALGGHRTTVFLCRVGILGFGVVLALMPRGFAASGTDGRRRARLGNN
jgi:hypothetical protein